MKKWPSFADGDRDDGEENTIFDQNTKNVVLTLKVALMPILEVVFRLEHKTFDGIIAN